MNELKLEETFLCYFNKNDQRPLNNKSRRRAPFYAVDVPDQLSGTKYAVFGFLYDFALSSFIVNTWIDYVERILCCSTSAA